ncbi:MAG: peptidoglycan recognition protein family protein [Lachnospiraceae bacterium]
MERENGKYFRLILYIDLILIAAILVVLLLLGIRWYQEKNRPDIAVVESPAWIEQDLLQINRFSRPGTRRSEINDIVVHYVSNPRTSARQNRNYFDNLADQTGDQTISASSHFIIGIDGEILQCIPIEEVAYANYPRNADTVSIECCHPDASGEFSEETKASLILLTAWLCQELNLSERNVIRHYDVIGKDCPKYYVEHEDEWKALRREIKKKRKESLDGESVIHNRETERGTGVRPGPEDLG